MSKPTSLAAAQKAIERLSGPEISYAKEDCQGFIKTCVKLCGGELRGAGTNDIYRTQCVETRSFDWRKPGDLRPGDMLFIQEDNGQEPPQYKGDGIGNVNHIGVYVGPIPGMAPEYCVIHSSQSRGKVAASTLKNAWNRTGRLKCLDF